MTVMNMYFVVKYWGMSPISILNYTMYTLNFVKIKCELWTKIESPLLCIVLSWPFILIMSFLQQREQNIPYQIDKIMIFKDVTVQIANA